MTKEPDYSISTPENVDLHLEIAGIGNRLLAQLIDGLIESCIVLFLVLLAAIAAFAVSTMPMDNRTRSIVYAVLVMVTVLLIFVLQNCYFIVLEAMNQGQTPGKKLAEIRVIEQNGRPIGWSASIIRNLLRIVDSVMLVGLVVMLFDRNERRIGDMLAGTLVVRERKASLGAQLKLTSNSKADPALDVGRVTPAEYDLLVDFLKRRNALAKPYRPKVAGQLCNHFRKKLAMDEREGDLSEANQEAYLEQIYLTYQARASD